MWKHKPPTGELQLVTVLVIRAYGDMLSTLTRSSVSRHQVVSRQSAGMQMCPQQCFNCYSCPICHRICSLPTALGPKLVSLQDILAVWWIHPLPALSSPVSDRRVSFLPPSSLLLSPMSFTSLCLRSLFFFTRNISQQGCAQQGPKPRLQRTSCYPSRWCANVAVDIKVFQLIIIRGIHRQVSLSYNLALICRILVEENRSNALVTFSWGQVTHVDRWNALNVSFACCGQSVTARRGQAQ